MLASSHSSIVQDGITIAVPGCPVTARRLPAVDIAVKKAGVIGLCVIKKHAQKSRSSRSTTLPSKTWLTLILLPQHGSDTGTFDPEGRWIPQHFEDIFSKYGAVPVPDLADTKAEPTSPKCLRLRNLVALHRGNRNGMDPFGWLAESLELFATWLISDGALKKEEMRGVFDGSLFYQRWEKAKARENVLWRAVGWFTREDTAFHERIARAALADQEA
ncbi:hypothetical protein HWV62_15130 [Athelia sp. TMB]|nr:hypothetical protein HWV62_15130 [Athelia sp. TMB]